MEPPSAMDSLFHQYEEHNEKFRLPYAPLLSSLENWFEREFFALFNLFTKGGVWMSCFVISLLYLGTIFTVQRWMAERKPYTLRPALVLWNLHLTVFSVVGLVRGWPEFTDLFTSNSLNDAMYKSVCHARYMHGDVGFWPWIFMMSKAWELGDTMFIVLRKQKLIFLHWYHHIATMIYCFFSFADQQGMGRWFYIMNYAVHSVMYGYFTMKACRLPIPKAISMLITTLQILQMFVGTFVNGLAAMYLYRGVYCQATAINIALCMTMYVSYVTLFVKFFTQAYLKKKDRLARDQTSKVIDSKIE